MANDALEAPTDLRALQIPNPTPRLVTVEAAARLLGIGRTTVYELISNGELQVVHIGRSARVPLAAIDAYVDRLRQTAPLATRARSRLQRVANADAT